MNYKQHLTINSILFFSTIIVLCYYYNICLNIKKIVLYFFIIIFLTLIPDIDSRKSRITRIFFLFYFIIFIIGIKNFFEQKITMKILSLEQITISTILFFLHYFYSKNNKFHRSFSHSLIFGIIITIILFLIFFDINILYLYLFFILHLIEDKTLVKSIKKDYNFIRKIFFK